MKAITPILVVLALPSLLLGGCSGQNDGTGGADLVPSFDIPKADCEPTLSGSVEIADHPLGIGRYAWEADIDGLRLDLEDAEGTDLGSMQTVLELNAAFTGEWVVRTTYDVGQTTAAEQVMRFRALGPDRIWLQITNRLGTEEVISWIQLDQALNPLEVTLAKALQAGETGTAELVTPEGRFDSFPLVAAGIVNNDESWIESAGLGHWLTDPVWQRFVTASNDRLWLDLADSQARQCDAHSAADAEASLYRNQQALTEGGLQSKLDGTSKAWNLVGAVGSAMGITAGLIAAGVISGGLAIGVTLVVATVAVYHAGSVVEGLLAPHKEGVKSGSIDGTVGVYNAITGDNLDGGAAKGFFAGNKSAKSTGDPHLDTFDGNAYDFQAAGEFVLARAAGFEVQTRQEPATGICGSVSVNTAVALKVGEHRVALYAGDTKLTVDGESTDLPSGTLELGPATLQQDGTRRWVLWWLGGEAVELDGGSTVDVRVRLPQSYAGTVVGLLGDLDGNPANDLKLADGSPLADDTWETLVGSFAEAWRVDSESSLFDYDAGQGPETFAIEGFPGRPTTLDDLPQDKREEATLTCAAAGITNAVVLEDCVLDVVCTSDAGFADSHVDRDPRARLKQDLPIFMDDWTQQGDLANGVWTVAEDGLSVTQDNNGEPTFFVSAKDYFDVTIRGELSSAGGDDDYVGFVFGYQSPLGEPTDSFETFILSWKGLAQDVAPEGLTLAYAKGTIEDPQDGLWAQNDSSEYTVLATSHGEGAGWRQNRTYSFELRYGPGGITVSLGAEPVIEVAAADIPAGLVPGRFGFYNYSQPAVTYSGFTVVADPGLAEPDCDYAAQFPDTSSGAAVALAGGYAYRVEGSLLVLGPVTVGAGALLCMGDGAHIDVRTGGSLTTSGTAEAPVRITHTSQTPGAWNGIRFASDSVDNHLTHTEISYAGGAAQVSVEAAGIAVDTSGSVRITASVVRDSAEWGLWAEGTGAVIVEGASSFLRNQRAGVRIAAAQIGGLHSDASYLGDNGDGDTVVVASGSIIDPEGSTLSALDASWRLVGAVTVIQPLVVQAGASVKMDENALLDVRNDGSLHLAGTSDARVRIQATTAGTPWGGIRYATAVEANIVEYADLSGGGGAPLVSVETAIIAVDSTGGLVLRDSSVNGSAAWGVWVEDGASFSATGNNTFADNADAGLRIAPMHMASVSGAGQYVGSNGQDVVWVSSGTLDEAGSVQALDAPYFLSGLVTVTAELGVAAGTRMVLDTAGGFDVRNAGSLQASGTAQDPVRITGADEQPGGHRGIRIAGTAEASNLSHVHIAHGGGLEQVSVAAANIAVDSNGSLNIDSCTISESGLWGLWVEDGAGFSDAGNSVFTGNTNAGLSVAAMHMGSVGGDSQYIGSNGSDVVWVRAGTVALSATWPALDAPYFIEALLTVNAGVTIEAGAAFSLGGAGGLDVRNAGSLSAVGTPESRITFSGATGLPGSHRGIRIANDDPVSVMQFVDVADGGGTAQVSVEAANIAVDSNGALTITDSSIRNSAGWGLFAEGTLTQSSNQFSDNASGDSGP